MMQWVVRWMAAGCLATAAGVSEGQDGADQVRADAPAEASSGASGAAVRAMVSGFALDGSHQDWPEGVGAAADERHVLVRFELPGRRTLLRSPEPVRVLVDFDAGAGTGLEAHGVGADVVVSIADPEKRREGRGPQLVVERYDAGGEATRVEPREAGLLIAPTFASSEFELRLDRPAGVAGDVVVAVVRGAGNAAAIERIDAVETPPAARAADGRVSASIPDQLPGTLRVMAWNVLWRGPIENAAPFARVFEAVKPDVVLLQEWGREGDMNEDEIAAWFNEHAGWSDAAWQVEANVSWGVAVASRLPIWSRGPDDLRTPEGGRWDFPIRLAAAAVETGYGPIVFGSLHMKCCGSLASDEDTRRAAEAEVINAALADMALDNSWGSTPAPVILGGDFNLVGDPDVMRVAGKGLDLDGSGLGPAHARVLGDPSAMYTFGRPESQWPRGRLDFITYPDAVATTYAAFVLDTHILDDASLEAMGLERGDVPASDHLPVVADIGP